MKYQYDESRGAHENVATALFAIANELHGMHAGGEVDSDSVAAASQKIYDLLDRRGEMTKADIYRYGNLRAVEAKPAIEHLTQQGLVDRSKSGRGERIRLSDDEAKEK